MISANTYSHTGFNGVQKKRIPSQADLRGEQHFARLDQNLQKACIRHQRSG